jgi:formylglycine-generating enzyme required for sulfatase activity
MLALAVTKWISAAAAGLIGLAAIGLSGHEGSIGDPAMRAVAMSDGSALNVAVQEVTRRDWQACVRASACDAIPGEDLLDGRDVPMTGVNHLDAEAYIAWRNAAERKNFRLPTAEEWNTVAAALPRKPYKKLFDDPRLAWAADYGSMKKVSAVLQPSGSFGTLANGIADLGGNVWEWTSSCAPNADPARCPAYIAEGQHEAVMSLFVRDPIAGGCAAGVPPANVGFRLVSDD